MSKALVEAPVGAYKNTPRPANCRYWIECFLHHHRDRNVSRNEIFEAAMQRHYSKETISAALNVLKNDIMVVHIGCWWVSKDTKEFGQEIKRGEYWRWYPITTEEQAKKIEDNLWFESLPG